MIARAVILVWQSAVRLFSRAYLSLWTGIRHALPGRRLENVVITWDMLHPEDPRETSLDHKRRKLDAVQKALD